MIVAIVGSRTFRDRTLIYRRLDLLVDRTKFHVISGAAKGVDTIAVQWAADREVPFTEYPAHWEVYGKRAGFLRNTELVDRAAWVVAFWDGVSRGTLDTITKAHDRNRIVTVIFPNGRTRENTVGDRIELVRDAAGRTGRDSSPDGSIETRITG